jgi:cob(I)alamin adenosyltransferase
MCSMKIYTKTGDKGTSSLFNGERRGKTDSFFTALGDVDEVNANVGLAREHCLDMSDGVARAALISQLAHIQSRLLDVGSAVATPLDSSSSRKIAISQFGQEHATQLEGWIDEMDDSLPALTTFILPSGGKAASHLHVARAVCRRAERSVVALEDAVSAGVRQYMNRLSDYLFTAARFASHKGGYDEVTYKKQRD